MMVFTQYTLYCRYCIIILIWGDILGQENLNIKLFSILVVGINDAMYVNNILLWRGKPSVIVVAAVVVAVEVVAAVEVEVVIDELNTANQFHNCNAYNSNIQA